MKKRIEHLLAGKFQNEQGQLLFSQDKITVYLKSGDTCRREMYFGAADERKIRGYVTSTDRRMVPGMEEFQGTAVAFIQIDRTGIFPDRRQGFFHQCYASRRCRLHSAQGRSIIVNAKKRKRFVRFL